MFLTPPYSSIVVHLSDIDEAVEVSVFIHNDISFVTFLLLHAHHDREPDTYINFNLSYYTTYV
jgi:hypothetical protein